MTPWYVFLLMSAIYVSPHASRGTGMTLAVVLMFMAAIAWISERNKK